MLNLIGATQDAIFRTLRHLKDDPELTALLGKPIGVFTHVPESTQAPFVKLGQISSEGDPENYDQFEKITIEIYGVFRGPGNSKLMEMMHRVRKLLDGQHIVSDVAAIQPPFYLSLDVGDTAADGQTYVATMSFEMMVEPA